MDRGRFPESRKRSEPTEKAQTLALGGFAVNLHARPRTTGDLDLWCGLDPANWERVKSAFAEFGFDRSRISSLGDAKPNLLVRFGYEPIRIGLFTSVADLDFKESWARRCTLDTGAIAIDFMDRETLIRSKIAAGRPQDLADLEQLRRGHD